MLTSVYETLRSAGRELVLELGERPSLPAAVEAWRETAESLAADPGATENQLRNATEALALAWPETIAERVLDLGALRCRGERAAAYEAARRAVERAALRSSPARDRDLLQELLVAFASAYDEAKRREAVVDFEDLQLAARDLLRNDPAVREEESLRFRIVMVDEFQDTNALQCDLVDLLTDGSGAAEVFTVGDEFQSIYGFRHADVDVFRARREEAQQPLVLRRNYRSRPEVLAAVNHLFEPAFGSEYQPLTASGDFPDPVSVIPSSCSSPTRRAMPTPVSTGVAARPVTSPPAFASSSTPTRLCRERSSSCSRPVPTPRSTRRSCGERGCRRSAPRVAGTSGSSRWSTCSRTCG